eukprot:7397475-Prorocentrum_lima.AAC.1
MQQLLAESILAFPFEVSFQHAIADFPHIMKEISGKNKMQELVECLGKYWDAIQDEDTVKEEEK